MKSIFLVLVLSMFASANAQGLDFLVDNIVNPLIDNINNGLQNYLIQQIMNNLLQLLGKRSVLEMAAIKEKLGVIFGNLSSNLKELVKNFVGQVQALTIITNPLGPVIFPSEQTKPQYQVVFAQLVENLKKELFILTTSLATLFESIHILKFNVLSIFLKIIFNIKFKICSVQLIWMQLKMP